MSATALITGASRGIGRAIAQTLAAAGWSVCLNYRTEAAQTQALAAQLQAAGYQAIAVAADVSDGAAVKAMVTQTQTELGPVSLLVNNAGISATGLFQDLSDQQWARCFSVNVDGARHCIQAVLPQMLRAQTGCIVNVSSIWGLRGASCEVAYACTKAALIAMTRSLAAELGPSHIRVNCVAPGVIDTRMLEELDRQALSQLAEQTPLGRLGCPEDVARAVAFLASPEAGFITGQVLTIDGGFTV